MKGVVVRPIAFAISVRYSEFVNVLLNTKDVRLEESVPAAMPKRIREYQAIAKQSKREMKFARGDRVRFERNS